MVRKYSDLRSLSTLEERYEYLRLGGIVGAETFGFERFLNQQFYHSREWRQARDYVIVRDDGYDLGVQGSPIKGPYLVHHIQPLRPEDIEEGTDLLFDPENLILTSQRTHNAIHYGNIDLLPKPYVERTPGDTLLWSPIERMQG